MSSKISEYLANPLTADDRYIDNDNMETMCLLLWHIAPGGNEGIRFERVLNLLFW